MFEFVHEVVLHQEIVSETRHSDKPLPPSSDELLPPKDELLKVPAYDWPPFNIRKNDGTWDGADTEIVQEVLNRMGYRVKLIDLPFKRILNEMRAGTYPVMLPCVIGGGREEYMLFSEPVSSIYSVLWKKKTDHFNWKSYEDLAGRRIGASYYHYGAGFLEAGQRGVFELDMVAAESPELVHFRKLKDGKLDMFICELSVGLFIKQNNSPEFDTIDYCEKGVGPTRFFSFPLSRKYFADHGYDPDLFMEIFNKELLQFAAEGGRKRIFDSYFMSIALDDNGRVILKEQESTR